jgi:1-phosphofructokinase
MPRPFPNTRDADPASVFVFAPTPLLTVTVESGGDDGAEIHLHAGGQGFWIARMVVDLGGEARLCGPFGGETGAVLKSLMQREGVRFHAVETAGANGGYIHDRRGGARTIVAEMGSSRLSRHEVDELHNACLAAGIDAKVAVLGGAHSDGVLPADVFGRLCADLVAVHVPVVADLSGPPLRSVLQAGLTLLKVSHEDLLAGGMASSDSSEDLLKAIHELGGSVRHVVVSRGAQPALALVDGRLLEVTAPPLVQVDHHGAGDSMTAGIAVALAQGADVESAIRLGAAAGALNVTRRGLATGHREAVQRLIEHVRIRDIS